MFVVVLFWLFEMCLWFMMIQTKGHKPEHAVLTVKLLDVWHQVSVKPIPTQAVCKSTSWHCDLVILNLLQIWVLLSSTTDKEVSYTWLHHLHTSQDAISCLLKWTALPGCGKCNNMVLLFHESMIALIGPGALLLDVLWGIFTRWKGGLGGQESWKGEYGWSQSHKQRNIWGGRALKWVLGYAWLLWPWSSGII